MTLTWRSLFFLLLGLGDTLLYHIPNSTLLLSSVTGWSQAGFSVFNYSKGMKVTYELAASIGCNKLCYHPKPKKKPDIWDITYSCRRNILALQPVSKKLLYYLYDFSDEPILIKKAKWHWSLKECNTYH